MVDGTQGYSTGKSHYWDWVLVETVEQQQVLVLVLLGKDSELVGQIQGLKLCLSADIHWNRRKIEVYHKMS